MLYAEDGCIGARAEVRAGQLVVSTLFTYGVMTRMSSLEWLPVRSPTQTCGSTPSIVYPLQRDAPRWRRRVRGAAVGGGFYRGVRSLSIDRWYLAARSGHADRRLTEAQEATDRLVATND